MEIKNSDIDFFHNGKEMFIRVRFCRYKGYDIYMALGKDNRPFDALVKDVKEAVSLLKGKDNMEIFFLLPGLLGWERVHPNLTHID